MDGADSEGTQAKVLEDSTDSDLVDEVAHAVSTVPDEEQTPEEQHHDADDFVPRQDRAATLDTGVIAPSRPQTFDISDNKEDEAKQEKEEDRQADPEEKKDKAEATSRTPASEPVGKQPAPTSLRESSVASSSVDASARAHSAPPLQSNVQNFVFHDIFKQTKNQQTNNKYLIIIEQNTERPSPPSFPARAPTAGLAAPKPRPAAREGERPGGAAQNSTFL